jgi:hypothetical protein
MQSNDVNAAAMNGKEAPIYPPELFLRPGRWRMGLGSWRGKSYCEYFILKAI